MTIRLFEDVYEDPKWCIQNTYDEMNVWQR